jgi:hypothetical protein
MSRSKTGDDRGYFSDEKVTPVSKYMILDDRVHEVYNIRVFEFNVGDAEDPDLYAGQPLYDWQKSEMGAWVMAHAVEPPMWHRIQDYTTYGYRYAITAKLLGKDHTFWQLRWNNPRSM